MNVPKLRFKEFTDEYVKLKYKDILKIKSGKDQKQVEDENGKYPILGTGGQIGKTNSFLYDKPSVLIGRKGTINKPQYMESPFWTVDTLFYSHIYEPNIPKYLFYSFQNVNWKKYDESTGVPSLSSSTIESVECSIPSPNEQKKISKFLSLLDKKIELQNKKIEDLKLFKKGLLKKQYNYIRNKNLVELSNIANIYQPQTIAQNKLDNGKYFVFGANGIIGKYSKYNHKQKQITISCRGENSGKVNITPEECWITGNSMVLNIDNNSNVDKLYLKYILDSQNLRYLISGSGQPQITRNVILKHKIPLLPILDQKKFRNPFIKLDLKILLEETKVNKLLDIKKGLMQNMFV